METDPSFCTKKSRKPYTLTKQRESWTNDEHERFIKALQLYNRDWKKIETYVGTKTVVQIRSHAQKYFQKVLKSGSSDAIPPPRPKRRAADAPLASQASSALPDTKIVRLTSEASTRAGSLKGEIDSDEGGQQQNSKQDISASVRNNDNVEANAQLEQARATVSSQSLQHVYLFIASMFSPAQANHNNMLQQLTERDRNLVVQLLRVLDQELSAQQQQPPAEQQQQEGQLQQEQQAKPLQERQQEPQQPGQQQPEQQQGQIVPALPDAAQRLQAAVQQSIQTAAAGPQQPAGQGAAEQPPLLAAEAPTGEAPLENNAVEGDTGTQAAAGVEQSLLQGAEELVATDGPPITDTGQSLAAVVVMAAGTEAQAAGQQSLQQGHGGLQQAAGSPDACLLSAPTAETIEHGPGGCQTAVHERQQPATDAVVAASAANQQQQHQALQQAKPQLPGAVGQGQQQQQVANMQPAGNSTANGLGSNIGLGARGFTAFAAYAASATQQR